MNIRRIVVYALFVALFPGVVFMLVGFFAPFAGAGLIDSVLESEDGWEETLQEFHQHLALGYRIAGVAVWLALAVVYARLVCVQRTKRILHLLGVLLLGWLIGQVVAVFVGQLTRALADGHLDEMPIWLWHVALRDLGISASTALVGGLAGCFLLRRRTSHA